MSHPAERGDARRPGGSPVNLSRASRHQAPPCSVTSSRNDDERSSRSSVNPRSVRLLKPICGAASGGGSGRWPSGTDSGDAAENISEQTLDSATRASSHQALGGATSDGSRQSLSGTTSGSSRQSIGGATGHNGQGRRYIVARAPMQHRSTAALGTSDPAPNPSKNNTYARNGYRNQRGAVPMGGLDYKRPVGAADYQRPGGVPGNPRHDYRRQSGGVEDYHLGNVAGYSGQQQSPRQATENRRRSNPGHLAPLPGAGRTTIQPNHSRGNILLFNEICFSYILISCTMTGTF